MAVSVPSLLREALTQHLATRGYVLVDQVEAAMIGWLEYEAGTVHALSSTYGAAEGVVRARDPATA
jgi:hypothetical protein